MARGENLAVAAKRQLALDTDPMTALFLAVIWLFAVLFLWIFILVSVTRGLPPLRLFPQNPAGLPPLLSRDMLTLLVDAYVVWFFWRYEARSSAPSDDLKISKLVSGIFVLHAALSIAAFLVKMPMALLWFKQLIGLLGLLVVFFGALIGIPLWLRSKIRHV